MKKKLTAFLTAVACLMSLIGTLSVSATEKYEDYLVAFTMIAEPTTSTGRYVMFAWHNQADPTTAYVSNEVMLRIFKDPANYPAAGDVVGINASSPFDSKEGVDITTAKFSSIYNSATVDTVYNYETEEFYSDGVSLLNAEGQSVYYHPMRIYQNRQSYDGLPNPSDAKAGDKLIYAINEYGHAVVCIAISPLGDVNADSTLNILDVILLNKAVLIGEPLPALETAARSGETDYGQCDFNGNGTLDLDDSLGMMKRIIGIEETE